MYLKKQGLAAFLVIASFAQTGCLPATSAERKENGAKWVSTWSTAPQLVEPRNMPPEPGLSHNTLRQVLRVSLGSDSLRVRFSNEFSNASTRMNAVQIAISAGSDTVDVESSVALTFNGNRGVTLPPGESVTSDPIRFMMNPRTNLAITIYYGETSPDVTGHPGSRTTSFLLAGNHVSDPAFRGASTTDHWYTISGIDVKAPESAAAVAILGNSITDGRGSGTNKQNRWPDFLSERLLANPATRNVAVLNQGIGGNCVLRPCLGPSGLDRFERDILNQYGVRWLIILEGINDLGQTRNADHATRIANELIDAYMGMIGKAHSHHIKVYGATILPMKESFYYQDYRETARGMVNEWIRTSGQFDAVIDFDRLMENPDMPSTMLPDVHMGDYLHPNEQGYELMGQFIDLKLFE